MSNQDPGVQVRQQDGQQTGERRQARALTVPVRRGGLVPDSWDVGGRRGRHETGVAGADQRGAAERGPEHRYVRDDWRAAWAGISPR
ncbi:hypothetical protein ACFWSF_09125 [Streptomyces sp. NPDC058611]|uniref:hypothetical protein n=1 Tax=unclassified Streptomyces TaxID=2593676 RepID=UPI003646A63A